MGDRGVVSFLVILNYYSGKGGIDWSDLSLFLWAFARHAN